MNEELNSELAGAETIPYEAVEPGSMFATPEGQYIKCYRLVLGTNQRAWFGIELGTGELRIFERDAPVVPAISSQLRLLFAKTLPIGPDEDPNEEPSDE